MVWQLADELTTRVYAITETTGPARDFRFCGQIRDAASSISRNIAEGFGRYRHKEFAQFLTIARGSAFELADLLRDGVKRRHWPEEEIRPTLAICYRAIAALTRLVSYLRATPDP